MARWIWEPLKANTLRIYICEEKDVPDGLCRPPEGAPVDEPLNHLRKGAQWQHALRLLSTFNDRDLESDLMPLICREQRIRGPAEGAE